MLGIFASHKDLESNLATFQRLQMLSYGILACARDFSMLKDTGSTFLGCRDRIYGVDGEQEEGCWKLVA